ncbi:MAG: GNAT family N-acetyltransferase [Candidatus Gastranaerophilales bacterium]|nr:GNAT family N-acetyltransferase [Candidatus Gastranaerophilales bacterium]
MAINQFSAYKNSLCNFSKVALRGKSQVAFSACSTDVFVSSKKINGNSPALKTFVAGTKDMGEFVQHLLQWDKSKEPYNAKKWEFQLINSIDSGRIVPFIVRDNSEKGKIIATSQIEFLNQDDAFAANLYVNNDFQNKGIGKILMNKMLDKAQEKHIKRVFLQAENPIAIDMYKQFGFKPVDKRLVPLLYRNDDSSVVHMLLEF